MIPVPDGLRVSVVDGKRELQESSKIQKRITESGLEGTPRGPLYCHEASRNNPARRRSPVR